MKPFFCALLLAVATVSGSAAATLEATAGLGGVAKAGRWTPIRVSIEAADDSIEGTLDIAWGNARLHRAMTLAPRTRKRFELYIRSTEGGDTIDVRLVARDRVVAATTATVRLLAPDAPVTLCVQTPDARAADADVCTAIVVPQELPQSPRGYEAIDRVAWPAGRGALAPGQQTALRAWESLEGLDASGDLAMTPQVTRPMLARGLPSALVPVVAGMGAGYFACVLAVGFGLGVRRVRLAGVVAALALVTAGACAAMTRVGWLGPTRTVHLHHTSLLQQVPGTEAAIYTTRGIAEFPAFDDFSVRLPVTDGMIEAASPTAIVEEHEDSDGFPVLSGIFGLGDRRSFTAEAVVQTQVVAVKDTGGTVQVTNQSTSPLQECRFADGFSPRAVGTLAPGASATATWSDAAGGTPDEGGPLGLGGPLLTCTMQDSPVRFTERDRPVAMHGTTTVAAYRRGAAGVSGD